MFFIAVVIVFLIGFPPTQQILISGIYNPVRKIICLTQGKEFLTQTNHKTTCTRKFDDAGKTCSKKQDCQGYCGITSGGAKCSEYPSPKQCYIEFANEKSPIYTPNEYHDNDIIPDFCKTPIIKSNRL